MEASNGGVLEFEKETPESLLPVLAETGQVVPAIKVIFDRDWSSSYRTILESSASLKRNEIETICNDNYSDFISSIDELLGVQLSVNQLQNKINLLNGEIQTNGSNLQQKISNLLILKQTRRNMDITINKLNRLKYILLLMDKIRDMMHKKKYISALKNLNQLTSHHLIQLQEYSVTRKIWDSVPMTMEKITKQVDSNFDEWMHGINKQGNTLGKLAFEQTKKYIQSLQEKEEENDLNENEQNEQKLFGLFIRDENEEKSNANVPATQEEEKEIDFGGTLFEKIENLDFNAIYQCIHIHETLGSIDQFVTRYNELRTRTRLKILNESLIRMESDGNTKKKKKKKKSKNKTIINNDFFYNLCGFYVIQHAVSSRYQQLMNTEQVQTEWDQSCKTLTLRIKTELLSTCKLPNELISIKNNVFILSKAMTNYDFKINHIISFLEELRIQFEKRLIIMLEKNVKKILLKDKFHPFTVQNIDDFECIATYNLDVAIQDNTDGDHMGTIREVEDSDGDDEKDDMYYDESDFPKVVPFSVSVPMICGYLDDFITYYENYSEYLSDMGPHIRQSVESAIKNVICQQLKHVISASKENGARTGGPMSQNNQQQKPMHHTFTGINRKLEIGELAQLAVNAAYLEKSCKFFERELATEDQINYTDNNTKDKLVIVDDGSEFIQIPKMHEARDALKSVMSQCVDALFERLGICVENILNKYMCKINWCCDKLNNNIHEWVFKLLEFLDNVLKNKIKYLPEQYRDSAYFITMARIKQFITTLFTQREMDNGIKRWNIISMYNFNLDIIRLETYSRQTLIPDLYRIFQSLRQLLDLLLSGKEILLYLNQEIRMEKYTIVETHHVRIMLEKYKTLGFLNKLPKHIKNLDKKTVQQMLKNLKDMD